MYSENNVNSVWKDDEDKDNQKVEIEVKITTRDPMSPDPRVMELFAHLWHIVDQLNRALADAYKSEGIDVDVAEMESIRGGPPTVSYDTRPITGDFNEEEFGPNLRGHLYFVHKNEAAPQLTDQEAEDYHRHEHTGPGTLRGHGRQWLGWTSVDRNMGPGVMTFDDADAEGNR